MHGNNQIINTILQHPAGQKLLTVKDYNSHTPMQVAYKYNQLQTVDTLSKHTLL